MDSAKELVIKIQHHIEQGYVIQAELEVIKFLRAERDRYEAAVRKVLDEATDTPNYVIISPHINEIMADIKQQLKDE